MNNNLENAFRQGFIQFLAGYIDKANSSNAIKEMKVFKQKLVAATLEELVKISNNDWFITKPIFKCALYLIDKRIESFKNFMKVTSNESLKEEMEKELINYNIAKKSLTNLINTIQKH